MIKLALSEITQMLDAGDKLSSNQDALTTLLSKLKSFANEDQLSGKAWSAAKSAVIDAYLPLVQGMIAYIAALLDGNKKIKSAVDAFKYGTPLDEQDLTNALDGYTKSKTDYEETVRELVNDERANPTMASYYEEAIENCQNQIENLTEAIAEINKQIAALTTFASSVSGAYDEANTIKAQLEKGFSALGVGGSNAYQNGQFTIASMSSWATSLSNDYENYEDGLLADKLNTKGMSAKEAKQYKDNAQKALNTLREKGWTDKGLAAYVSYLNEVDKTYKNGKVSRYDFMNSTLTLSETVLLNTNANNTVRNKISFYGKTYVQYWLNGKPSDLLSKLGEYDPNFKSIKTQNVEITYSNGNFDAKVNGKENTSYSNFFDKNLSKPTESGPNGWVIAGLVTVGVVSLAASALQFGLDPVTDGATGADGVAIAAEFSEEGTLDTAATDAELEAQATADFSSVESDDLGTELNEEAQSVENNLPKDNSQLKHIFDDREGHIPDTPENRSLLENLANNPDDFTGGPDSHGNMWYSHMNPDGTQTWVETQNGVIQDGGVNEVPRSYDKETGLSNNPFNKGK